MYVKKLYEKHLIQPNWYNVCANLRINVCRGVVRRLGPWHWSGILSQYNESVAGRYVVVLPAALVSHRVPPELAAAVRHPDEREPPPLRWQALAAALDPIDILPGTTLIQLTTHVTYRYVI